MRIIAPDRFAARGRTLQPGQVSRLCSIGIDGQDRAVLLQTTAVIEAPNWAPDGRWLIFNAGGQIWRMPADGGADPERIPTDPLDDLNNDHVLSPDGTTLYLSSDDGHLYAVPVAGGTPRRVSNTHAGPFRHYLHGVSPDGTSLSYVAVEGDGAGRRINIFTLPAAGGPDIRLSDIDKPNDGPEFSPDGAWIYFNSEREASVPGHAQIYRMRPDGSGVERLTRDARVNWFPHVSPDGAWVVYLSYPEGTTGHPPDRHVTLMRMRPDGAEPAEITAFLGGQGTINVASWAPDSRRFAYVAYPIIG